jgi:hypothetical protein
MIELRIRIPTNRHLLFRRILRLPLSRTAPQASIGKERHLKPLRKPPQPHGGDPGTSEPDQQQTTPRPSQDDHDHASDLS